MASLSAARQPAASAASSCLGCMARRSARPMLASTASASSASAFLPAQQTRGKKVGIRHDNGVVVRLLEDVPQFGRKDAILRTDRGRMRNLWYPRKMAEYMTTARLAAMGVSRPEEVIVDRDYTFGVEKNKHQHTDAAADEPSSSGPSIQIQTIDPARAAVLLETMLPTKLVFYRKPINAENVAIFGSVSAEDVAVSVRDALRADEEASLIRVEARDVRFVLTEADAAIQGTEHASSADRLKALGKWEVEITIRGHTGNSEEGVPPVRKIVEVLNQED